MGAHLLVALALLVSPAAAQSTAAQEIVADVRVQGNLTLSDQDLIALAGIQIGAPVSASTTEEIAGRLRASRRFQET